MKITEAEGLQYILRSGTDTTEYPSLCYDSRKVTEGCLFICMKGMKFDAHDVIAEIAQKGAAGVIIDHDAAFPENLNVYQVPDSREALSLCAAAYFGYPARKLKLIGITGTKGKTTTAAMVRQYLMKWGKTCGMIGTLGFFIGDKHTPGMNTTPESYTIQKSFREMVDAGCEYCVMEVSSQAYLMQRVAGIHFDYALFTNISRDHIGEGEHKDFADYLQCKTQLFRNSEIGFLNADDAHAAYVREHASCEIHTFARECAADYRYENIRYVQNADFIGLAFDAVFPDRKLTVDVAIPGEFNAPNAMGAVCICRAIGVPDEILETGLADLFINGRMELVYSTEDLKVIVDFAHNEVSAENILKTLRAYQPKRLVVVFGCGGNRSVERRYGMGRVCGELADFSIITEDNNRMESFEQIAGDIHREFDKTGGKGIDIPLRPDAVRYVIEHHEPGDIVAIIGKGHETGIDKGGVVYAYTDQSAVRNALEELGLC